MLSALVSFHQAVKTHYLRNRQLHLRPANFKFLRRFLCPFPHSFRVYQLIDEVHCFSPVVYLLIQTLSQPLPEFAVNISTYALEKAVRIQHFQSKEILHPPNYARFSGILLLFGFFDKPFRNLNHAFLPLACVQLVRICAGFLHRSHQVAEIFHVCAVHRVQICPFGVFLDESVQNVYHLIVLFHIKVKPLLIAVKLLQRALHGDKALQGNPEVWFLCFNQPQYRANRFLEFFRNVLAVCGRFHPFRQSLCILYRQSPQPPVFIPVNSLFVFFLHHRNPRLRIGGVFLLQQLLFVLCLLLRPSQCLFVLLTQLPQLFFVFVRKGWLFQSNIIHHPQQLIGTSLCVLLYFLKVRILYHRI